MPGFFLTGCETVSILGYGNLDNLSDQALYARFQSQPTYLGKQLWRRSQRFRYSIDSVEDAWAPGASAPGRVRM